MKLRQSLKNNGLSLAMFGIFAIAIIGMSIAGWYTENDDLAQHGKPQQQYGEYLTSGTFVEAVFENWESEFLQMWALVILTVFLYQKGSTDSKPLKGSMPQETNSRLSIIRGVSWKKRTKATWHFIYSHSLGLALFILFAGSLVLHAVGGVSAYNETQLLHNGETITAFQYVGTSQFWFESLQNWQSEFLAVGCLLVLSIYLRERGSQQSKPVGKRYNAKTGE